MATRSTRQSWIEAGLALWLIAGLGGLLVVGMVRYIRLSHGNEPTTNLRNLYQGAAAYYATGASTRAGHAPAGAPRACTVASAITLDAPSSTKHVIVAARESSSFTSIGFVLGDPVYYQYVIESSRGAACGQPPSTSLYRFEARGDLDGDGEQGRYALTASSDEANVLVRTPGISHEGDE